MSELYDTFVNCISRANAENKDRRDERPEESFFPVAKRVFVGSWALIEAQPQKQKNLICGICK